MFSGVTITLYCVLGGVVLPEGPMVSVRRLHGLFPLGEHRAARL